ncbi:hypothetical protein HRJ34_14790 [Rhizorhabdus wittichii]|uniref:Uncharacterized protein n=1 Tax=Rhizorhabdus wittichii TaxID=160791 RepID=A0A975CYF4_9SPHN|nr:hypothetical protein [Rhizorhabdus wittichii]QTH19642.1 hypothetical protein HRJ34_14790 [Rhizorhabdus wittichii]
MSRPTIDGRRAVVPASKLLQTVGDRLEDIRREDDFSYVDLGQELGRHPDQAGKYCRSTAEMPMTTFLRACQKWRGRLANPVLALMGLKMVEIDTPAEGAVADRRALTIIMRAQAAMSENLEDDDEISDEELVEDRAFVEAGGAAFDRWRLRLAEIDRRRTD